VNITSPRVSKTPLSLIYAFKEAVTTLVSKEIYVRVSAAAPELSKTTPGPQATTRWRGGGVDTKPEPGTDLATEDVILIDELLTPCSSSY